MKHYIKFLQLFPNKNVETSAKCEQHKKSALIVVNGRTSGLTRTHTTYACSAECLWDEVMNARWEKVK